MSIPRNYDGLTMEMVILIKHKSHTLVGTAGYTKSDRDDIESELAWHLRESLSKHDSKRSKLMSFANMVLNSKIASMIESRKSWYFDFRAHAFSINEEFTDSAGLTYGPGDFIDEDEYLTQTGKQSISKLAEVDLKSEITSIVAGLPIDLKNLCEQIIEFGSIPAVSKYTGIPRGTLYDRVRKLKRAFKTAGFQK